MDSQTHTHTRRSITMSVSCCSQIACIYVLRRTACPVSQPHRAAIYSHSMHTHTHTLRCLVEIAENETIARRGRKRERRLGIASYNSNATATTTKTTFKNPSVVRSSTLHILRMRTTHNVQAQGKHEPSSMGKMLSHNVTYTSLSTQYTSNEYIPTKCTQRSDEQQHLKRQP